MTYQALLVIFLFVAISLVTLIMMQQGKSADIGNSFSGAGASSTLFGSGGSGNFMIRMTAVLAIVFFVLSMMLGNLGCNYRAKSSHQHQDNKAQQVNKVTTKVPEKPDDDNNNIKQ